MRQLPAGLRLAITLWLAAAAAAHLYFAGFGFPAPVEMRATHLLLFVPPLFLLYPARRRHPPTARPTAADWLWCLAAALPHAWVLWHATAINDRMEYVDPFTPTMMGLGLLCIVTLLEAIRRAVEPGLAVMVGLGLLYMLVGHFLPGVLHTRPFSLAEIVEAAWLVPTAGGVYGPLTGIVATTIAVFVIFGAFMQASGAGRLFANVGSLLAGRYSGGTAKVAVISSGLFGTMSGSSVSNVITTGSMTIPVMIRTGYRPAVAAGIESAASVGGLLMPPVMGAAAFVMAEIAGIAYAEIIVAAAIGAVLYFFAILCAVHLEAKRSGLAPMPPHEIPTLRHVAADLHLLLPIVLLVWLLMARWSGNFAAFAATIALFLVACLRYHTRMGWRAVLNAFEAAGLTMAPLAVTIAGAGIVISSLTATGMVVALGGMIKEFAGGNLALLLILLGVTVIVLGMGIPTTPAYIIAAAIGVPQILELGRSFGVEPLQAHLFVFYFAVLADATPPVAAAAFAAAAIAKAPPLVVGLQAARFAIAGFAVGFAFIYDPAIMLRGSLSEILLVTAILAVALVLIAAAYVGFLLHPLGLSLRCIVGAAGVFAAFVHAVPDELRLGVALGTLALVAAAQWLSARRRQPA